MFCKKIILGKIEDLSFHFKTIDIFKEKQKIFAEKQKKKWKILKQVAKRNFKNKFTILISNVKILWKMDFYDIQTYICRAGSEDIFVYVLLYCNKSK